MTDFCIPSKTTFLFSPAALLAALLTGLSPTVAQETPSPPCAESHLEYPKVGELPKVRIWTGAEDLGDWAPPTCTGWSPVRLLVAVETAGRFQHVGTAEDLLARFGAMSRFPSILYWSHTRGAWRELIPNAAALASTDSTDRRDDFTAEELTTGTEAHFWQVENTPASEVVYRMRVLERSPDGFSVSMQNVNTLRQRMVKLLDPGGYQFLYVLTRESGEIWRYYSLMRASAPTNSLVSLIWPLLVEGGPSYINRTVAQFRYFSGIVTDQDPPAAR